MPLNGQSASLVAVQVWLEYLRHTLVCDNTISAGRRKPIEAGGPLGRGREGCLAYAMSYKGAWAECHWRASPPSQA